MLVAVETRASAPFAGGVSWGACGPYERLVGVARGELDPAHPAHAAIVDLGHHPRNPRGQIDYAFDWCLLRPADAARRSGTVVFDITNRGRKFLLPWLCGASADDAAAVAAAGGDGLFLRRGASLLWSGWDASLAESGAPGTTRGPARGMTPGARSPNLALHGGAAAGVAGRVRDAWVCGTRETPNDVLRLSYPAAALDTGLARLTLRHSHAGPRLTVPATGWTYVDAQHIRLTDGLFESGVQYELLYPAARPPVAGIGFAAVRDLGSLVRHGVPGGMAPEAAGPLAAAALGTRALLGLGISQAGRFLRDFVHGGWNADPADRKVFDGLLLHVAGAGGVFLNTRFAQPGRTVTQFADQGFPEHHFPFSTAAARDPVTGQTAALLRHDATDPLWLEVNTASEYWQKGASLLHTDPLGSTDLQLPDTARAYLLAGSQHAGAQARVPVAGMCRHAINPQDPAPVLRALLVALEEWVRDGRVPPASRLPRLADGTLVAAADLAFPAVPGVTPPATANAVRDEPDWVHPAELPSPWAVRVPQVDADGNERAGVRLPAVAVPLGTLTGWNFYGPAWAAGEMADRYGSFIPFAVDAAARQAALDPRPSLQERHATLASYQAAVTAVVAELVAERLVLADDAPVLIDQALHAWAAVQAASAPVVAAPAASAATVAAPAASSPTASSPTNPVAPATRS